MDLGYHLKVFMYFTDSGNERRRLPQRMIVLDLAEMGLINFIHSSPYDAALWICGSSSDSNRDILATACSVSRFSFSFTPLPHSPLSKRGETLAEKQPRQMVQTDTDYGMLSNKSSEKGRQSREGCGYGIFLPKQCLLKTCIPGCGWSSAWLWEVVN